MITTTEAKAIAKALAHTPSPTHSQVLEAVAHAAGCRDWNTFVARADTPVDAVARQEVVPILRVFDHQLAKTFYVDFLGFTWNWQHQFEPGLPVYAEVERDGSVLHLSERHGNVTPGGAVMVTVEGLDEYRESLLAKENRNARPGIEESAWGRTMLVLDPLGNASRSGSAGHAPEPDGAPPAGHGRGRTRRGVSRRSACRRGRRSSGRARTRRCRPCPA